MRVCVYACDLVKKYIYERPTSPRLLEIRIAKLSLPPNSKLTHVPGEGEVLFWPECVEFNNKSSVREKTSTRKDEVTSQRVLHVSTLCFKFGYL